MLTSKEFRDKYKISIQTLHNWRKLGKVSYTKISSGKFLYDEIIKPTETKLQRKNVIYTRVSNTKQKQDLIKQEQIIRDYMISKGILVDQVYSDIASGMNAQRKQFNKLIESCIKGEIDTIYISYKDRFSRFGFDYFPNFLDHFNVTIEILNSTKEEDFQEELTEDLVSIIHHFSMKMYSARRRELNKFKRILEEA